MGRHTGGDDHVPTSDKHRSEATRVGVDVNLTKPHQDADLLLQVRSLCAGKVDAEAVL